MRETIATREIRRINAARGKRYPAKGAWAIGTVGDGNRTHLFAGPITTEHGGMTPVVSGNVRRIGQYLKGVK